MTDTPTFTKSEALRRIRLLASTLRRSYGLPKNAPAEIGTRTFPVAYPTLDEAKATPTHPDDDLADFADFKWAASMPEVAAHGAVVHIYVSQSIGFGEYELYDVGTCWMGTPDADPEVLR